MTAIVQTLLFMLARAGGRRGRRQAAEHRRPRSCWSSPASAWRFVPGLPKVELAPELVLLVILPPLIYSAGVAMSWREFKFNLRPIALLAFGCVLFTTCAVARGRTLSAEFRLGGRLSARRDHFADRRGGAARHRAEARPAAPHRGGAGGRRPRQRRHRAGALPLRRGRGKHRNVFAPGGFRHFRAHRHRRDRSTASRSAGSACACGIGRASRASRSRCR